jgi:hypothetical protein
MQVSLGNLDCFLFVQLVSEMAIISSTASGTLFANWSFSCGSYPMLNLGVVAWSRERGRMMLDCKVLPPFILQNPRWSCWQTRVLARFGPGRFPGRTTWPCGFTCDDLLLAHCLGSPQSTPGIFIWSTWGDNVLLLAGLNFLEDHRDMWSLVA